MPEVHIIPWSTSDMQNRMRRMDLYGPEGFPHDTLLMGYKWVMLRVGLCVYVCDM